MGRILNRVLAICVVAAWGCSGDFGSPDATVDVMADIGVDVIVDATDDGSVGRDAGQDADAGQSEYCQVDMEWTPDQCSAVVGLDTPRFLVPRPVVFGGWIWTTQVSSADTIRTSWLSGVDGADESDMARIDAERGLERVADCGAAGVAVIVHPDTDWVAAASACPAAIPDSVEAYRLFMHGGLDGRFVFHVVAPGPAGRRAAFATIAQMVGLVRDWRDFGGANVFIADAPATETRGVIETFYGAPYTEQDRRLLLPYLAGLKFNQYIYAAKMDIYMDWIGPYWSEDWDQEYIDFLERLAADISAAGMVPGIQIRPLDQVTFSSSDDVDRFMVKVRLFADLGFRIFSISFDDTEKKLYEADKAFYQDSYDAAVIDFSRRVFMKIREDDALSGLRLAWVPNDYYTNAPDAETALPLAGEQIPAGVAIGWTGSEVIPVTITADDADDVAEWLERKPLLGDNYPVYEPSATKYFLGPLVGRAPDLLDHVEGIMFNPNPAPFPSLPALATCADYAWNPRAYDPDASMFATSQVLGGFGPAGEALLAMAENNRSSIFHSSMAPALQKSIDDFWIAVQSGEDVEDFAILSFMHEMSAVADQWEEPGPSEPLRASLRAYAAQMGRYGRAGILAVNIVDAVAGGGEPNPGNVTEFDAVMADIAGHPEQPTGDVMKAFLERVAGMIPR